MGSYLARMPIMSERFISEPIKPLTETADTSRMAIGEPGLPKKFIWRGRTIYVSAVLRTWRKTGKCRHGSTEMYVRRHWYEVATESDGVMKIYCNYPAKKSIKVKKRLDRVFKQKVKMPSRLECDAYSRQQSGQERNLKDLQGKQSNPMLQQS